LLGGKARGTSFFPYPEQCIADPNGRYYVVVKRKDKGEQSFPYGPVTLTVAERRQGSPPVRSASARGANDDSFRATVDPKIRIRDGDIVHGRIDLDQPPGRILVSSTGKVVVTLDLYGFNNLGPKAGEDDLVIYSVTGQRLHRKARHALFDEEQRHRFPRIDGALAWLCSSWLDDKRDLVVIVGNAPPARPELRPFVTVSLASGEVRQGGPDLVDRAIAERNPHALYQALDLAKDMKLRGSKAALPGIVEDGTLPLAERLRAAVLLGSLGDLRGRGLVSKTVLIGAEAEAGSPKFRHKEQVYYAIQHCAELLGEDALPLLKKTLQQNGPAYSFAHYEAFGSLGRRAVPTLISVLEDDRNFDSQLEAATCLGFIGPEAEEAVPALIKALGKKGTKKWGVLTLRLDTHAAWALEHLGEKAKAAIPALEQLAKDTDEDVRTSAREALAAIRGQRSRP
jgi:HEAT repeat protein